MKSSLQVSQLPLKTSSRYLAKANSTLAVPTEEVFGRALYKAFKLGDAGAYLKILPTHEEYRALLELMLQSKMEGMTPQRIDEMVLQRKSEFKSHYLMEFMSLQNQAQLAGIDWSTTEYVKLDCLSFKPKNFKFRYLDGDIHIQSK